MKKKTLYCWDCGRSTPHIYVGKESPYEGCGPARGLLAAFTLGMSETSWADHFWQCEICGRIRKQ